MPHLLTEGQNKTIGTKQTAKAIEKGLVSRVYIAGDADEHVTKPLVQLCAARSVPVVAVDTMLDLGKACGIEVGCASAALLKE